jgi:hypothetical protein
MFIERPDAKLLGSGLGDGMGGSPDFLAAPLETPPIGRIELIDGRHVPVWSQSYAKCRLDARRLGVSCSGWLTHIPLSDPILLNYLAVAILALN